MFQPEMGLTQREGRYRITRLICEIIISDALRIY